MSSQSVVQWCAVSIFRSDKVTVHFINRDGEKITVKGSPGESLLDVVINEDLDIDGFGMEIILQVWIGLWKFSLQHLVRT